MSDAWPATKGLSVYNALKLGGPMTPPRIADYLREHWDPETTDEYVAGGIAFIAEKSWISQDEAGQLRLTRTNMKAIRTADDRDLVLATSIK